MEQNTQAPLFELQVDHQSSAHLADTARWAKFIAIVGFIFCGLLAIVAIFAGSFIAGSFGRFGGGVGSDGVAAYGSGLGALFTIIYIIAAIVCFFPNLFLFNFASKMKVALRNNDQEQLNNSFRNLKACYRFIGILLIIYLGFAALMIVFNIMGSAFR
jgi:uncharacterized protein DUF5362